MLKSFSENQHSFVIKAVGKVRIERNFLIKDIKKKPSSKQRTTTVKHSFPLVSGTGKDAHCHHHINYIINCNRWNFKLLENTLWPQDRKVFLKTKRTSHKELIYLTLFMENVYQKML